ncbi:hypothetical protein H6769_06355 [Candidatus Peribacteria bacterium]|nr:hypothetical protein [Candidatus Peribacteria bacterium]
MAANKLNSLPTNFGKLKQLQTLNLTNNLLETLPDSFG